jgi:hypothetical protein
LRFFFLYHSITSKEILMIELKDGHPIAKAIRMATWVNNRIVEQLVVISCPYCGEAHYHGIPEGFRVPHCATEGGTGPDYWLRDIFPGRVLVSEEEF